MAGVHPAAGQGLRCRRGRPGEPLACGALTTATPVGGGGGLSCPQRLGALRAWRPSWVPPRGGRGTEAAARQEHVKQQQLEEQQPQRPQPQRLAWRPCGKEGEPVRGPEAGPQPAPTPPGEPSAFAVALSFRSPNPGKVLPGV